ncbi:MAG: DNA-binding transcriptional MerR regulator/methylmalonyl-CoA mutase cobalamin-binding subunit [Arenicella sp.]|jgi:DNA-binding transcriptional MerR regulator/methylmalonyl-CoA mutase cobalamin-binding subunit
MNKEAVDTVESDKDLYPISTVAKLTGVNAITLRAWERRYQLFEPMRKSSGHRVYTQQNIDCIIRVVGLLDRGMRIGQVKAKLQKDEAATGARDIHDSWKDYLDNMIAAAIRFDEASLDEAYSSALSLHPAYVVTERLVMPVLTELGRRWAEGEGSIAEEHFFAFFIRNKLGAQFHHCFKISNGPKLLMACLPGELHETGLLLTALAAREMGYHTILLGSDMPLEELPAVASKTDCDAIVLSAMLSQPSSTLKQALADLTSQVDVPVFLGGKLSVSFHNELLKVGVQALGTDISTGLQRVSEVIPLR